MPSISVSGRATLLDASYRFTLHLKVSSKGVALLESLTAKVIDQYMLISLSSSHSIMQLLVDLSVRQRGSLNIP
jgi:hypothetical protein